ncbi:MAG: DUF1129 domain-containing protein, partial [Streptococcaceae bacterium]|nr:DUF1129 domain-containing protein [Streptococcaceae bacterium]
MEATQLQKINAQNKELEGKLTKKNAEYIFSLKKQLEQAGVSEIDRVQKLNGLLVEIVEKQKTGVTARQLFGTVTNQADILTGKEIGKTVVAPDTDEDTRPVMMWLDNSLLLLAALGVVAG